MRTEANSNQSFDSVRSSMQRNPVSDGKQPTDAQGASAPRDARAAKRPSNQAVRDFSALMQRDAKGTQGAYKGNAALAVGARHAPGRPVEGQAGSGFQRDFDLPRHAPGWIPHADAAQMQAVQPQALGAPPPAASPPAVAPALAELIEKHVRQMLVSETATSARGGDMLLRMSDAALPGTDIWLRRTERGWKVRAEARSRDSYDAIVGGSEQLIKRFAEHGLGELDVEPVYQEG